jgi:hypothetical protein
MDSKIRCLRTNGEKFPFYSHFGVYRTCHSVIDDDREQRSSTILSFVVDSVRTFSKERFAFIFKISTSRRPRTSHVKDEGDIFLRSVRKIPPRDTVSYLENTNFYENFKSLLSLGFIS